MKETDQATVLYQRLYKALQQAAISEGQRLKSMNTDQMKDTCPHSKLNSIAILELREYLYQLIDRLNMSNLVMFEDRPIRSFSDAVYIVKQFRPVIIPQLSAYDFDDPFCPYESVINCADEFSGVSQLTSSGLVINFNQ